VVDGPKQRRRQFVVTAVFHTRREGERALRSEWSSARALWEQAEKVGRAKARFDRRGIDRKQFHKDRVEKARRPPEGELTCGCPPADGLADRPRRE
jgi:hypothetical protein